MTIIDLGWKAVVRVTAAVSRKMSAAGGLKRCKVRQSKRQGDGK